VVNCHEGSTEEKGLQRGDTQTCVELNRVCQIGITLVEVPYWWDGSKDSLVATIRQVREDLLPEFVGGTPIPLQDPNRKNNDLPIEHGYNWDGIEDLTGW